jgi:nicotinamide mononucleotide transporter
MSEIIDFLFSQYSSYSDSFIFLEFFAVIMNIISVMYAKQNNILVYPTGLIGTGIFVYILFNFSLLGDMIINGYFFIMSIYGWYYWSRKKDEVVINNISKLNKKEYSIGITGYRKSYIYLYYIYAI